MMGNWNPADFFYLTKNPNVTITHVGGFYEDVPREEQDALFWFGDQFLGYQGDPDCWGRTHLDQAFVNLCRIIYLYFVFAPDRRFLSHTARKEGDKYFARVRFDNEDIEMEVEAMILYFQEKTKAL